MSIAPKFIKRLFHRALAARGYRRAPLEEHFNADGMSTIHHPRFLEEDRFQAAWAGGYKATGSVESRSSWRIHIGVWAAQAAAHVPGDFVECGVNAGYVSSVIVRYLDWKRLGKRFFLVDTFAGPVFTQFSQAEIDRGVFRKAEEALESGGYVTDAEAVRRNFEDFEGVVIVTGEVPAVLPSVAAEQVAFLHLDMNCAFPECEALRHFWDRMPAGGVVLFDDYAHFGYEAQGEALDAAARDLGASILSLPTGQGLLLKPS